METTCSYNGEWAWFSSDERRWHTRILRYAEQYPDQVTIIRMPKENDGCIYAKLPSRWVCIRRPAELNMTDEEKLIRVGNMRKSHQNAEGDRVSGKEDA